jgi:hypothetical protein
MEPPVMLRQDRWFNMLAKSNDASSPFSTVQLVKGAGQPVKTNRSLTN